ncbi:MAG: DUF1553 domain-containing protein [Planctomycetes bacterium]|nr:DUF1553 domain-containing protein [Planctomycetota bacterium]
MVCFVAWLSVCGGILPGYAEPPETIDFNFHIRPILSDRCYACHGPDAEDRAADLRLDVEEGAYAALEGGEAAHVIKPGAPDESELYLRVSTEDEDLRMPPEDSNLELSTEEIALIRKWIEQGAEWKPHWSFISVEDPPLPKIVATDWPKNPIDYFILARLENEDLQPAEAAGREKLLRRASFDLTGLPPTLKELDAFLADKSPDAYEKVVDRLLASTRYGERMAIDWLDLARYADTFGFQSDVYRAVWPWRDWVVEAFNQNMSFDEFITWQLAGDLLPDATQKQVLATAFNRLHRQTNEGGSIEEEFRTEYVIDRTDTFGMAFLGLTLGCARCHDHKYDPISQQEYYQLFSFFNSIDESGLYSHFTNAIPTPTLMLSKTEQQTQLAQLLQEIEQSEARLAEVADEQQKAWETWLAQQPPQSVVGGLIGDFGMETIEDGKIANRVDGEKTGTVVEGPKLVSGKVGQGLLLSGENQFSTEVGGAFSRHDPFSIGLWINTSEELQRAVIWHHSRSWTDAGSRGYQLLFEEGQLSASVIHFWPGNAIRVLSKRKMPIGQWIHVLVSYDGSSRAAGLKIYVDGKLEPCSTVRDKLTRTIAYDDDTVKTLTLGQRFRDRGFKNGMVDELKIYDRELTSLEAAQVAGNKTVASVLAESKAEQQAALRDFYLRNYNEEYRQASGALQAARKKRGELVDSIAEIMVMKELPEPRPTFLLERGAYDAPGEQVTRDAPASLGPMSADLPRNRLGLARWLTDGRHPLTARVAVNRYWQSLFGIGLAATPDDLGSQGQLPTHPELLDWLAHSFVESGWDIKQLLKRMVMSATYRQSSQCTPEVRERDPVNILFARGPHEQLSAEMLRDEALFASGQLVEKQGGPPVKPYQPAGLWKEKGTQTYERDKGEGSHRRSLYTYWKRTSPPPGMLTLNAAKRDVCLVKRQATATPLQSLVLLNDPQYVESARALAQKVLEQVEGSADEKMTLLFRTLTSRTPSKAELLLMNTAYEEQRQMFTQQPERAKELLAVGDLPLNENLATTEVAALTVVAEMVMNFEESVTK